MRWIHRIKQWLAATGQLLAAIVSAIVQTRHEQRATVPTKESSSTNATGNADISEHLQQVSANDSNEIVVNGKHIELPAPSIWPAVVALGITLLMFGFITGLVYSYAGLIVLFVGLGGWIGALHHG